MIIPQFLIWVVLCSSVISCAILPPPIRNPYTSWMANEKLSEGQRWAEKRQYDRAEAAYREAIAYRPDKVRALIDLGDLYFTIQSYDRALEAYEQALAVDPHAYEARAGIWGTMLEKSSLDEEVRQKVLKEIETYINQVPANGDLAEYLYAAFLGFEFLQEDKRKSELRERIVQSKPKKRLLDSLSGDAAEEIFGQADVNKRLPMMDLFYSLFPPSTSSNLVHQNQLRILATDLQDLEQLRITGEKWLADEPDNRTAQFAVGYWFTEKEVNLEKAVSAIRKAMELLKHPD